MRAVGIRLLFFANRIIDFDITATRLRNKLISQKTPAKTFQRISKTNLFAISFDSHLFFLRSLFFFAAKLRKQLKMIAVFGKANIGLGAIGEVMNEAHASHRLNAKFHLNFMLIRLEIKLL